MMVAAAAVGLSLLSLVGIVAYFARTIYQARALHAEQELAKLRRPEDLDDYPPVTVIIPARDEASNIRECLEAVLAADYPRLRVVVADDDSSDDTAAIAGEIAARDPRLEIVSQPAEPGRRAGWVSGKSYVLWRASYIPEALAAEWLLFLDADTRLWPDSIWKAVTLARRHDLRALSGSGIYRNPALFGDLMEAMLYGAVFLRMPIRDINREGSPRGWLNGQMILIREDAYRQVGGHRAIGGFAFDDLALGHLLKRERVRYRFLPGAQLYECVNYTSFASALVGWRRLLAGGTPWFGMGRLTFAAMAAQLALVWLVPPLALGLVLVGAIPDPAIAGLSLSTLLWVQVVTCLLVHGLGRLAMKLPIARALLYPVAAALALAAVAQGYRARFRRGAFEFRGRTLAPDVGLAPQADGPDEETS